MKWPVFAILAWCAHVLFIQVALAESSVSTPYIDKLKSGLEPEASKGEGEQPYIDSIKEKLKPDPRSGRSYIDELKGTDPNKDDPQPTESYVDLEKRRIDANKPDGSELGAIEAVKQGKSELKLKRSGKITGAAGVRVGVSNTRTITASPSVQTSKQFSEVYANTWVPDVTLFGEVQPFHSEWFGNIGAIGSIGYASFKGVGKFAVSNLSYGATTFGENSKVDFRFHAVPATLGLIYRFNLLRIIRPYVSGGGVVIGFLETRTDGKETHRGKSLGVQGSIGVAILLDFLSRRSTWDLYSESGVKHSYLTVEYNRLKTTAGDVKFNTSGAYAGMTFEY